MIAIVDLYILSCCGHDFMLYFILSDFNHTQGRDFSPYPSYTGVAKPAGVGIKPSTLSLQEMEAERSVSRARKNRTCFTEKQVRYYHMLVCHPSKNDTLSQCCFIVGDSVADDGPTLKQHWLNVSCLLGPLNWLRWTFLH